VSGLPAYLRETSEGCTLAVRVQPGAKRTAIIGVFGDGVQLKIALQAPPVDGRANEALIDFLAHIADLPKSSVAILSGQSSRSKVCILKGVTSALILKTISNLLV
jgi:hypothetical protein